MIELNSDTEMYWNGCFVESEGEVYQIIDVVSEEIYDDYEDEYINEYRILAKDLDGETKELFNPSPYFPKLGYRQVDKTVVYLSRTKVRQYKKGLHSNNVTMKFPQLEELDSIAAVPNISYLQIVIEQEYPSLDEAISMIDNREKYAVALHNWWAIVLKVGHENPLLFYRQSPVGEIVDGEVSFYKDSSKNKFEWEIKK